MEAKRTQHHFGADEYPSAASTPEKQEAGAETNLRSVRRSESSPPEAAPPLEAANEALAFGCLVVGRDAHFAGALVVPGSLRVEGRIDATVEANDVTVLPGGMIVGEVICVNALVYGTLKGEIRCSERLSVATGGVVEGDIHYFNDLCVESGAILNCRLNFSEEPAPIHTLSASRESVPPALRAELDPELAPLSASLIARLFGSSKNV